MTAASGSASAAALLIAGEAALLPAPALSVADSLEAAADGAARLTAEALAVAAAERGSAHLVLTGGSGGRALAGALPVALAAAGLVPGAGLEAVHLWFGDERFVPLGDPERNDGLVGPLLEAGIPEANLHRVAGPEDAATPEEAAERLAAEIAECGPADGRFDVMHLGMGPDAHVCSLFPGHPAALTRGLAAVAVRESPKPPPVRVSLTFEVLHAARHVMVVAAGAGKVEAVRLGLGTPDPVRAPASSARGERTTWFLDREAAAGAPGSTAQG